MSTCGITGIYRRLGQLDRARNSFSVLTFLHYLQKYRACEVWMRDTIRLIVIGRQVRGVIDQANVAFLRPQGCRPNPDVSKPIGSSSSLTFRTNGNLSTRTHNYPISFFFYFGKHPISYSTSNRKNLVKSRIPLHIELF